LDLRNHGNQGALTNILQDCSSDW
jgi:hypothetical protein